MDISQWIEQQRDVKLEDWLTLSFIPGFGFRTLFRLLKSKNISVSEFMRMSVSDYAGLGFKVNQIQALTAKPHKCMDEALSWQLSSSQRRIISIASEFYPERLREISQPPLVIYCEGNVDLLRLPQIAIVGTRNVSANGSRTATSMAEQLSKCGWIVTSGMALGVDTCAHKGVIQSNGNTIAVLGSGLNHIYPRRNLKLSREILVNGGLMVSEFSVNTSPRAENFPRRNRIISGMSLGVLVIEAAIKSGSLITARYALEQNREVFACPGSIYNPMAKGCHQLLRQGAKLVEQVSDINEEFDHLLQIKTNSDTETCEKNQNQGLASDRLLASVEYETTCLDVVVQRSRLPVNEVTAKLLEYELRGLVASVPGGYIRLGE